MIEHMLQYLESIDISNDKWAQYVLHRLDNVQRYVDRFRRFANLRKSKVQLALMPILSGYQARIDALDKSARRKL